MKKILSLILVLSLVASLSVISFAQKGTEGLLKELGIDFVGLNEENSITRGQFASYAAKLYYNDVGVSEDAVSPFTDVNKVHPYFPGIYTLSKLGVISGNGKNFRPDDAITYAEASTIILKCAGYGLIADSSGGYPSGYLYIATINGVFKNVSSSEEVVKVKDAEKMLYNSLFLEAIELSEIKNGEPVYRKTGKIILSERYEVVRYDGIVTDDTFYSFDNSGASESNIISLREDNGNTVKMYAENDFSDLFGKYSVVYARYSEEKDMYEALYGVVSDKVTKTTVYAEDIITKSTSRVEYMEDEENGIYKTINFSSPYVFVNGKRITSFDSSVLKPKYGFVEFVDNDGNNTADVIFVWDFAFSDVVDRIDEKGIGFKKNPSENLKFDEDENVYRFIKNGEVIDKSLVTKDNTLSVVREKVGSVYLYTVFVSEKKVSGTVTSVEGKERITVEGIEVSVSSSVVSDSSFFAKAKIGEINTFYIDYLGDAVYCVNSSGGDVNYFYIIDMKATQTPDGDIRIYAYTRNAVFSEYIVNVNNVIIDGVRLDGKLKDNTQASAYDEMRELLCTRPDGSVEYPTGAQYELYGKKLTNVISRPAIYKVNSKNEIIYIDTDAPTYPDKKLEEDDTYTLKPGIRYLKDTIYTERNKTFNGRFNLDESSTILKVADIDRYNLPTNTNNNFIKLYEQDLTEVANYYVYSPGELTRNMALDIQAYNIDPETGVCGLAIIRGTVERNYSNNDYRSAICIFDSINEYYDSDLDKTIYKMYYWNYGNKESVKVDSDELPDLCENIIFGGTYPAKDGTELNVEPLKQGDAIYINVNSGYLTHLHRDLDISRINDKSTSSYHSTGAYNPYYATSTAAGVFDVPYDQRDLYQTHDYSSTYIMDLALPYSVSGNILALKKPAVSGASLSGALGYTSLRAYINSNGNGELVSKFINHSTAGFTLVEEISHDPYGNCEFRISEGSIADIKYLSGYSEEEGFYQASRVFTYDEQSNIMGIIIYNLKEEHNHAE